MLSSTNAWYLSSLSPVTASISRIARTSLVLSRIASASFSIASLMRSVAAVFAPITLLFVAASSPTSVVSLSASWLSCVRCCP